MTKRPAVPTSESFRSAAIRLRNRDWDLLEAIAKNRMLTGAQAAEGRRNGSVSGVIEGLIEAHRARLERELMPVSEDKAPRKRKAKA